MQIITSQHYLEEAIIAEKSASRDYGVALSPAFEVDGEFFQVILDGHHSLAAAQRDGAEPEWIEYDRLDHDAVAWLDRGDVETFLAAAHMGEGDYIDAITGNTIWV